MQQPAAAATQPGAAVSEYGKSGQVQTIQNTVWQVLENASLGVMEDRVTKAREMGLGQASNRKRKRGSAEAQRGSGAVGRRAAALQGGTALGREGWLGCWAAGLLGCR